ncbi:MAG: hypothetical protein LUC32_01285 [Clostridiales bacterium]|nr:hypothetical protein [Clostridiales bacterium]
MDVTEEKKTAEIFRQNLATLLSSKSVSMRQLSKDIDASDSYVQKVLAENTNPSFEKIDCLSEYYDLKSWELFYDFEDATEYTLAIIQQLNHMPRHLLPHVQKYMEFLLQEQDSLPESGDMLSDVRKEE